MYSAVATDLGQTEIKPSSNIVADSTILQAFSEMIVELHVVSGDCESSNLCQTLPYGSVRDFQDLIKSTTLQVTPSVILTDYLCTVPRMKSTGSLFVSILLADLVLLKTAWTIYCLVVQRCFLRKPTTNYCEGCFKASREFQQFKGEPQMKSSATLESSLPKFGTATKYEPVQLRRMDSSESLESGAGRLST
jgi:hypothetical protein